MSFILEALRKSEHQRQREEGPGIAGLPARPPPSRLPLALLVVGALLAINVVVLLFFLLRPAATPPAPADVANAPAAEAPPVAAALPAPSATVSSAADPAAIPPPQAPVREVRPLADEAVATGDTAVDAGSITNPEPPPAPDPSLLPQPTMPRPAGRVTAMPASQVPRIDTLPPADTAGLPELNLDLHIYADNPAQRAVFINGRRYREGDALPEGVDVIRITTDGVELGYRGRRFLLPRQ